MANVQCEEGEKTDLYSKARWANGMVIIVLLSMADSGRPDGRICRSSLCHIGKFCGHTQLNDEHYGDFSGSIFVLY